MTKVKRTYDELLAINEGLWSQNEKLWKRNAELEDALKSIIDECPEKPKLPIVIAIKEIACTAIRWCSHD